MASELAREIVRFWTARTHGHAAALFRVAFGCLSLWTAIGVALNARRFFSESGLVPWRAVSGFDYASWSLFALAPESTTWPLIIAGLLVLASLGLLLGLAPRVCMACVFVIHVSLYHRNPYLMNSGDRLFTILAGIGMFLPLGRVWALGARTPADAPPSAPIWSQRLVQLQICHVYWFSCFAKLKHARWQQGLAMQDVLASPMFAEWPFQLTSWPISALLTWSALIFELGFPVLVWQRRLRPYVLAVGIVFHGSIDVTMMIPMFSAIMIVSYALFLTDDEARELVFKLTRFVRRSEPARTTAS